MGDINIEDYILRSDVHGLDVYLKGKDADSVISYAFCALSDNSIEMFDPSYKMIDYIIQASPRSEYVLISKLSMSKNISKLINRNPK